MKNSRTKDFYFFLTLCLIAFHITANVIWLSLNNLPPPTDAALHSTLSIRFQDYFLYHLTDFSIYQFLTITNYYPPVLHVFGALIGFVSPYNYKIIQLTGTIFFALSMIFLYLYTKVKTNNGFVAFLSVFFFGFFFYIFKESHDHMTDIPLIASFLAGIYFLNASSGFMKRKNTILFFVCFAIASLVKWTAPVFFIVPFIFEMKNIFKNLFSDQNTWRNIGIGISLALLLVSPWYFINFENIVRVGKVAATAGLDNPTNLLSLESIIFYPHLIIIFQLSFLGFIFLLLSLIPNLLYLRKKFFWEIICLIVFCYSLFTFFLPDKNIRLLFPIMPFFAILLGHGAFLFLKKYRFGVPLVAILMGYYFLSYFILSFGIPFAPQYKYAVQFPVIGWLDIYYWHHEPASALFDRTDWKNEDAARSLNDTRVEERKTMYFINVEKPYFNASTIHSYLYKINKGIPISLQEADANFQYILKGNDQFKTLREIDDYVNLIDILFIPEKEIGPVQAIRDRIPRKQIQDYMLNNVNPNFVRTQVIKLPDGDTIFVYKRRMEIVNEN